MRASVPSPDPAEALRPPLKWAGGMRWQVPRVRRLWRGHEQARLVEPFCGGLAVALANQATPRVVALYRKLGFRRRFLEAPRMIGCTGARTPTLQLLATRNL